MLFNQLTHLLKKNEEQPFLRCAKRFLKQLTSPPQHRWGAAHELQGYIFNNCCALGDMEQWLDNSLCRFTMSSPIYRNLRVQHTARIQTFRHNPMFRRQTTPKTVTLRKMNSTTRLLFVIECIVPLTNRSSIRHPPQPRLQRRETPSCAAQPTWVKVTSVKLKRSF